AVIDACYRASQAGVPVDIWVRGICAIRPGVPGLSENVRVRSVLGRFLEHSRVFAFGNGGEPEVWIGSADMMHRNLDRRIEALVRVTDPAHRGSLNRLLETGMSDTTASSHLAPDGEGTRPATDPERRPLPNRPAMLIDARRRRRGTATPCPDPPGGRTRAGRRPGAPPARPGHRVPPRAARAPGGRGGRGDGGVRRGGPGPAPLGPPPQR